MAGIVYGKEQKIDAKDKKILKELFLDGRMSVAEVSKRTKIQRDSVARRIKRMEKEEIITGFVPVINPPALGLPNIAITMFKIKTDSLENKKKFEEGIVANKYSVHISTVIGKYDYVVALVYRDTNHLNQIIEEMKRYIPDFIVDFELFQVVDEPKFEMMAQLL
ncbi:Lrp/AsnC family transcriptional regulator [Candidatus Woesearchaeota archaeon]|jgi:Lrp/AsnC family transcriptional regulator, leucine-responsive regulatory protein|nr:Lrp/AsnC family transcriptional regulator [Candidatus Woesearchaeota archaeon]MBT6519078.1 Lrp/AsnC family transcriptional regulator [Candidatus Woesearchaeota archaeon]MBT7367021.1 Lrp/AsnC family transcriptional regulator [Candidatus Woesearchaeota archaeon]